MADGTVSVAPILPSDYDQWLPLWRANNHGSVSDAVTTETWRRLNDPSWPVHGIVARYNDPVAGMRIAGLVHYITHPVTGHVEPACYMQDLFVDADFRRRGIGRLLVEALSVAARHRNYTRLYWLAEADNEAAQALYHDIGLRLPFTFHVLPLT